MADCRLASCRVRCASKADLTLQGSRASILVFNAGRTSMPSVIWARRHCISAIRKDNRAVVRALVEAGAKTNIVSEFGATARALAAERNIDISGGRFSQRE